MLHACDMEKGPRWNRRECAVVEIRIYCVLEVIGDQYQYSGRKKRPLSFATD